MELSVASGSEGVLAANEEQNLPVNPGVPEPIEEEEEEEVTEDEEVIDEPDMPKVSIKFVK